VPTRFTFLSEKLLLKKIQALLLLKGDNKHKKNFKKTHSIVKLIHLLLRPESKNLKTLAWLKRVKNINIRQII